MPTADNAPQAYVEWPSVVRSEGVEMSSSRASLATRQVPGLLLLLLPLLHTTRYIQHAMCYVPHTTYHILRTTSYMPCNTCPARYTIVFFYLGNRA